VILRWIKFATVGAAGLAVQLAMLWMLTRGAFPVWLATAIAVETAVLHNFVWHEVWTWRGHPRAMRLKRLWRFHLATGAISIVSNTALTVAFKQWLPIPLLAANVLAVGATAILNFVIADRWVFKSVCEISAVNRSF
jgi:putative flippase GtrA